MDHGIFPSDRRGYEINYEPRLNIDHQGAENINNIARDQYNTQVLQERESFLREIAATKTRARFLVILGFLMLTGGIVAFMLQSLNAINELGSIGSIDPAGFSFLGPTALIGFAIGFIGQFVLIAGIIMHIVAAARRRRLDRH